MRKPADTQYAIHDFLKERWSPRAFSSQPVEIDKLLSLFEAARWSPSGGNSQPWSFVIATQDNAEAHQKLISTMTGRNPLWANNVPVLVLAITKLNPEKPAAHRYAYYDLGQAVAHLSIQATVLGLRVHQMAGFDWEQAHQLFDVPEGYQAVTVIAIGYAGTVEDLPEELRAGESAPRIRKPMAEFVFNEGWNKPLGVPEAAAVGD